MDIAGGGIQGLVAEQDLEGGGIGSFFSQIGGEAVPQ